MLSKALIFVCSLFALLALYLSWTYGAEYSRWIIAPVVVGATVLVMAPQIDWWWLQRYPPKTDLQVVRMFEKYLPRFASEHQSARNFLLYRTELFMKSFDWTPQGFETIPADARYVISVYAALLTRLREKFLLTGWEKIIFYKNPFPSPQYPKNFHNSEIFAEDKVMLFNIQALMNGFLNPAHQFPVGLYELARVYNDVFQLRFTDAGNVISKDNFSSISGGPWEWITEGIGIDDVDIDGLAVVCYFLFPDNLNQTLPVIFERCKAEFA